MDRQRADLPLDPRRLRNDDPNHRRGGYGRDRSPRSRSRIYLISPRGTTVPRQRVRPTLNLLFFFLLLLFPPFPPPPDAPLDSLLRVLPPHVLRLAVRAPLLFPTHSRNRCDSLSLSLPLSAPPLSSSSSPLSLSPLPLHVYTRIRTRVRPSRSIPMLIKRNTDPRYLSHAWRRSAALRRLPDILSPASSSHELDEYIYKR